MQLGAVASSLSGPLVCTHSYSAVTKENRGHFNDSPILNLEKKNRKADTRGKVQTGCMVSLTFMFISHVLSGCSLSFCLQLFLKVSLFQSTLFLYTLCLFHCSGPPQLTPKPVYTNYPSLHHFTANCCT